MSGQSERPIHVVSENLWSSHPTNRQRRNRQLAEEGGSTVVNPSDEQRGVLSQPTNLEIQNTIGARGMSNFFPTFFYLQGITAP